MKRPPRHIIQFILFGVIAAGLFIIYDYPEVLLKRPQSVHNWRQCDGASLALNYYQEGMHFFKPQTHMLYSDQYTSGYTAPSEIPVLYYFVALLYRIFGYHEFIFRAVSLFIFLIGLFYLFKLSDVILHDLFYSTVVNVLIFSSPLLVYYANNFMPNTVALSLSFIGWYWFYMYYQNRKTKTFMLAMVFFGIAATMKITELTGPVIIMVLLLSERLKIRNFGLHANYATGSKILSIVAIFALVGGWVMYAKYYNNLHSSSQFSTYTFPIWEMSKEQMAFTLHKMNVLWFKDYFYPATFWFMLVALLLMVLMHHRSDKILLPISMFITAALVTFSLLWFQALGDHDYFYIGFYVLPAFVFINFFKIIKESGYSRINDYIIRVVFFLVAAINIYHAQLRHSQRYSTLWINDYKEQKDLYTINPWLSQVRIDKEDTVIFYPSVYIRPLYLMNVKGWIIYNHDEVTPEIEKRDSVLMNTFMNHGAEYFITSDLRSAVTYKPFIPYLQDLYAHYNDIYIFRIPPEQRNFSAADTSVLFGAPK